MMNKNRYVKSEKKENIFLTPGELCNKEGPNGLPITVFVLPRMGCTIRWVADFLSGKETGSEYEINGIAYRAFRDAQAVFFEEIRSGQHTNIAGFSLKEIPDVLEEMKQLKLFKNN